MIPACQRSHFWRIPIVNSPNMSKINLEATCTVCRRMHLLWYMAHDWLVIGDIDIYIYICHQQGSSVNFVL